MKLFALLALGVLLTTAAHAVEPPSNLRIQWMQVPPSGWKLVLTWDNDSAATGGYRIDRRLGGVAWPTTAFATVSAGGGSTVTWEDPLTDTAVTTALKSGHTTYSYRVRPLLTADSTVYATSEVCTVGTYSNGNIDTDADGILDSIESQKGLNALDWADGSGDSDGDGVPNAWEINLGTEMRSNEVPPATMMEDGVSRVITITVDPSAAVTTTSKQTISAALTGFAGGTTALQKYRIIRVKPGIYNENLVIPDEYNIAILPLRTPKETFINNGTGRLSTDSTGIADVLNSRAYRPDESFNIVASTNSPIITATGNVVINGFVLGRNSGTKGPAVSVSDDQTVSTTAARRAYQTRLVNCIIRDISSGTDALIKHSRSRLVISHCTLFMNRMETAAAAHSYSTGTAALDSTARLQLHNSIFWNPINLSAAKPEFQTVGEVAGAGCTVLDASLLNTSQLNPGLTPLGFLASPASAAYKGGAYKFNVSSGSDLHAPRDIHGELRFRDLDLGLNAEETRGADVGADQFMDTDEDGIPDFADQFQGRVANSIADLDADELNEHMEYLSGTDVNSADSPYLTVSQARAIFSPISSNPAYNSYYTKSESNAKFLDIFDADDQYLKKVDADATYLRLDDLETVPLRVPPGGDISMGRYGDVIP